jgi:hypothetical protein
MTNPKNWLWIILFGSLWGVNEVLMGEFLARNNMPHFSVFLAVVAFFLLATARGIVNKPSSSTMIGTFAVLFKLINATPFYCHLLGIFMMGMIFDVLASLLLKNERRVLIRRAMLGILSAYIGNAFFAIIITYIVRYELWTREGLPKVLSHIFVAGSLTSLFAAVVVPLGLSLGSTGRILAQRRPRWTYAGTLASIFAIWIFARILN